MNPEIAITHIIVIKWKEKYDAVVVDCHHSLRLYGDRMKMNLPKIIFLGRLPLLPGFIKGKISAPRSKSRSSCPLAYSLIIGLYNGISDIFSEFT